MTQPQALQISLKMKISDISLPPIIGVAGRARSGKDTFAILAKQVLLKTDQKIAKAGFADSVKDDLHKLLVQKCGISAFTEIDEEKKLIRPLLVSYGTDLMRTLNEDVWINRMQPRLDLAKNIKAALFITDVRYKNEIEWIKKEGGKVVYIDQENNPPANKEEKKNDPILKEHADIILSWQKVGEDKIKSLKPKVTKALKEISCKKT